MADLNFTLGLSADALIRGATQSVKALDSMNARAQSLGRKLQDFGCGRQRDFGHQYRFQRAAQNTRHRIVERHLDDIQQKLASLNGKKADYALCIRANIYPKEIIATIREHSNVCVNYQWDGVGRFPDILEYLDYFDRSAIIFQNGS